MPTRGCGSRPRRFAATPPSRSDGRPTPGVPSNAGPSTCSSSALVDDDVAHGCRRPGGAPMAFCSSAVGCSSRMSRWLSVQRASALTAVAAHDDRRTVLHVVDVAVELRLQFLGGDRSSCCGGRREQAALLAPGGSETSRHSRSAAARRPQTGGSPGRHRDRRPHHRVPARSPPAGGRWRPRSRRPGGGCRADSGRPWCRSRQAAIGG